MRPFGAKRDFAKGRFEIDLPALDSVLIAVLAPGFRIETLALDARSLPIDGTVLDIDLDPGAVLELDIVDSAGQPVRGATGQFIVIQSGRFSDFDTSRERLLQSLTLMACTARTSAREDFSRIRHMASGEGSDAGRLRIENPYPGDKRLLVVWANGFRAFVGPAPESGTPGATRIVLLDAPKGRDWYRLVHRGRSIRSGTLFLVEQVEDVTPALPPMACGKEGTFHRGVAEPGKPYRAVLDDMETGKTLTGTLTFGMGEVIDISDFE